MNPESQGSSIILTRPNRGRHPFIRTVVTLVLLVAAAVTLYSIYVAVHAPDSQETVILGQRQFDSGCPAGLRVLVRNRTTEKAVRGARIEFSLSNKATGVVRLGDFRTDSNGSLTGPINIPELPSGKYLLVVDVTSSLGRDHLVEAVQIREPARLLLSSDRPIYQPGQTIHFRSLILNRRTEKPFAGAAVTFEVRDPKGNEVFKAARTSSRFGIASAGFVLASELNLGRYAIRAQAGAIRTERTVEVKRYVLPKFKVQITTAKPYYLPGQTVSGFVQADYFFGQPVGKATVMLTASTLQEKPVTISSLQGRTDSTGRYAFHFVLPDFFVGLPQKNGRGFLDLTAEVRDTAGHAETKTLSLSVAEHNLEVTAIPEAGALVLGVENILYVLTAYPDGQPAPCKVFVNGNSYQSSSQGLCEVRLVPTHSDHSIEIRAVDSAGRSRTLTYCSTSNQAPEVLLLRSDKAVYTVGQTVKLNVLSPEANNTVFLDVIQGGHTVVTKSVPLTDHRAEYSLSLPSSLVGMLNVHAYLITKSGEDRGCSRIICVKPASALRISARLSKPVYRPGQIATVNFSVTDADGKPTPAALGIDAVDESVFALDEGRPGLLRQFFEAEGELLKPRYQINFFGPPTRLLESDNQSLAAAYLASLQERSSQPSLDDLVRNQYLPRRLIERVRAMRGTPAYQRLRSDPRYAPLIRVLEGGHGWYSLRDTTGPMKVRLAEAHRQASFDRLKRVLQASLLGLFFLLPLLLLMFHARRKAGVMAEELADPNAARYVRIAGSLYDQLAALTLLPLVCYPAGAYIFAGIGHDKIGWLLLGFETVVVLFTGLWQFVRLAEARADLTRADISPLRISLVAFLVQFGVSRAGFVLLAMNAWSAGGMVILWLVGSFIAPLLVLTALNTHVQGQLARKGITARFARIGPVEILIVIALMFLLGAMFLPALAKAKAKAQRITLVNDLKQIDLANRIAEGDRGKPETGQAYSPRVRHDFPETLLWRPELITDDRGHATLEIPLADSITTWRASVDGISAAGEMGSVEKPIKVFQDFFVDIDSPVSMSLGDQVSVPVTCDNYLNQPQNVRCTLAAGDWFDCPEREISVHLAPNEVKSVRFPIKVLRVGNHSLRVTAQGNQIADAMERQIRVVPTGERIEHTKNLVLKTSLSDTFTIPAKAIPDSQSLWVKFYPSRFSEVVEGLDSIFQAPHGCFEQTSSTTYPDVLALEYLKHVGRLTPEIEVKAQKYINAGYQRLLTFEVPGGGFEWFGRSPAHVGLTAYGILEFTDMSHVHPVDQAMIERTKKWLYSQQKADGSWNWSQGLDAWSWKSPVTAYGAWALAESGDQSPALDKALDYLRSHPEKLANNYPKALAANACLAHDPDDAFGHELLQELREAAVTTDKATHWVSRGYGMMYSHGPGLKVETTALCAMAMMKAQMWPMTVKQALTWLSEQRSNRGTWGSTQATILAMRALILGSSTPLGQQSESAVTVLLNGEKIETFQINKADSDVMKRINLSQHLRTGRNRIQLVQDPAGELPVQLAGVYWLPADSRIGGSGASRHDPLQITLHYDRTTLAVNDLLKCVVTIENHTARTVNMAIVDLGVPPGFEADTAALERMQTEGRIARFEVTGNQIILYLRTLSASAPFRFQYSLRAKYPLRVQAPPSVVYEYYDPANRAETQSAELQVREEQRTARLQ